MFSRDKQAGLILFADDQYVIQQTMIMTAREIGIGNKLCITSNGDQVVGVISEILQGLDHDREGIISPYQPIALLLLDVNMPMLNGLETTKAVKDLYL